MEINPNRALNRIEHTKRKGKPSKSAASSQTASTASNAAEAVSLGSLEEELKAIPEIRSEKIKEGEVLARDPHYPDREDLEEVGKLIVQDVLQGELSRR